MSNQENPEVLHLVWSWQQIWWQKQNICRNDLNTAEASGYSMVNIRAQQKYKWGPFNTTTYVGIDNLFERKAVGSVHRGTKPVLSFMNLPCP
jgi:hypothetical protein